MNREVPQESLSTGMEIPDARLAIGSHCQDGRRLGGVPEGSQENLRREHQHSPADEIIVIRDEFAVFLYSESCIESERSTREAMIARRPHEIRKYPKP